MTCSKGLTFDLVQLGLEKVALASAGGEAKDTKRDPCILLARIWTWLFLWGKNYFKCFANLNSFKQNNETAAIILPILQTRKLRHSGIMSSPRNSWKWDTLTSAM